MSFLAAVWEKPSTPRPEYAGLPEVVSRGAFTEAIETGETVLTINHNAAATLATCRDGMLMLKETSVGLQATAWVDDNVGGRELMTAIKTGRCLGASFLFDLSSAVVRAHDGLMRLEKIRRLVDVSLCFGDRRPAYAATAGRVLAFAA